MSTSPLVAERVRGVAFTIMITVTFAAFWGLSGSTAFAGPVRIAAMVLVAIVTAIWFSLAVSLFRTARHLPSAASNETNPFATRPYQLAVLAQFIAIPVAARLLTINGHPDAMISAVAVIVGLHFFGLIPAFQSWSFAAVGGAMALLGLASLALPPSIALVPFDEPVALRAAVVGLGCACILWGSIIPIAAATRRQLFQGRA